MILSANQPYFFPYIGYWQLIRASDVFVVADDYNYIKNGWINRNRILINGQPSYFKLDVHHASQNRLISEHLLTRREQEQRLRQLQCAYGKAPFFRQTMELVRQVYDSPSDNLADFLTDSIRTVCGFLDIQTEILRTSDLENNCMKKREYRIYDMCSRLGADTYYNAIGGRKLYDYDAFREHGLDLAFLKSAPICYRQFGGDFVPNLSILDVLMFNPVDEVQDMLIQFSLIKD